MSKIQEEQKQEVFYNLDDQQTRQIIKDFEINAKTKNIIVEKIKFIEPANYVPMGH